MYSHGRWSQKKTYRQHHNKQTICLTPWKLGIECNVERQALNSNLYMVVYHVSFWLLNNFSQQFSILIINDSNNFGLAIYFANETDN